MPVELGQLPDGLRRKFRGGDIDEDIGVGGSDGHDLGIDGGVGDLVGNAGNDYALVFVAQHVFQAENIVLAEVVVLIEQAQLGVRIMLQDVGRVDTPLRPVVRLPAYGPR